MTGMRRQVLGWLVAIMAGGGVVAAVTFAANRVSTQSVGISSEPRDAGRALAPAIAAGPPAPSQAVSPVPVLTRRGHRGRAAAHKPRAAVTAVATPARSAAPAATTIATVVPAARMTPAPRATASPAPSRARSGDDDAPRSDDSHGSDDHHPPGTDD